MASPTKSRAPHKAVYAYQAQEADELTLSVGDEVHVQQRQEDGWWFGVIVTDGAPRCGLFPGLYVERVVDQAAAACLLQARVRGRLARAAPPPSQESDPTISLIREWERRAVQAEESLAEERRAAQAFREATSRSLEVLETTLAKSLAPLGGVVLEAPRGDASFWEVGGSQRPSSRGDALGRSVAEKLSAKIRQGVLGRRVVAWEDFCDALVASLPRRRRKDSDDDHGVAFGRGGGPHRRRRKKDDLNAHASKLQARVRGHQQRSRRFKKNKAQPQPAEDDDRLTRVLARFQKPLREVFRKYRKGRHVSAPDFLKLCREEKVSPALLSHQEVAAVCRATLGESDGSGLDEANLSRALARVACAAYAAVPTMGVGDKVEALFIHMGLAERLVEAARQSRPAQKHPFDEPRSGGFGASPLSFGKQRRVKASPAPPGGV